MHCKQKLRIIRCATAPKRCAAPFAAKALIVLAPLCAIAASAPLPARAQSVDTPTYRFLSGPGTVAFVGYGTLRGLIADGRHKGREESLRTGDALFSGVLLSEAIKLAVREPRPDRSANDSFPSGHATAAFAVAAMQSRYHTNEAPLWFLGAALIGDSRVRLHKHYLHDVVAGGALGILTAEVERHQTRGLLIAPFYRPDGKARGLTVGTRF